MKQYKKYVPFILDAILSFAWGFISIAMMILAYFANFPSISVIGAFMLCADLLFAMFAYIEFRNFIVEWSKER
jgi:hypothetical protein